MSSQNDRSRTVAESRNGILPVGFVRLVRKSDAVFVPISVSISMTYSKKEGGR